MRHRTHIRVTRRIEEVHNVLLRRVHLAIHHRDKLRWCPAFGTLDAEHAAVITADVERVVGLLRDADRTVCTRDNVVVTAGNPTVGRRREGVTRERKPARDNPVVRAVGTRIIEVQERILAVHHRVRRQLRGAVARGSEEVHHRVKGRVGVDPVVQERPHSPRIRCSLRTRNRRRPRTSRRQRRSRRRDLRRVDKIRVRRVLAVDREVVIRPRSPHEFRHNRRHAVRLRDLQRPQHRLVPRNIVPRRSSLASRLGSEPAIARCKGLVQHRRRSRHHLEPVDLPVESIRRDAFIPRPEEPESHRVPSSNPRNRRHAVNERPRRKTSRCPVPRQLPVQHVIPNQRNLMITVRRETGILHVHKVTTVHTHLNHPAIPLVTFKVIPVVQRDLNRTSCRNRNRRRRDRPIDHPFTTLHIPVRTNPRRGHRETVRHRDATRHLILNRERHRCRARHLRTRQIRLRINLWQFLGVLRRNLRVAQHRVMNPHLRNAQPGI